VTRSRSVLLLAALAMTAGAVHASLIVEHADEYWAFGAFFAACAVIQISWGIRLLDGRGPVGLRAGVAGMLGVVALWAFSRTLGLPLGPEPGQPEAVGAVDVATAVAEVAAAMVAATLVRATRPSSRAPEWRGARVPAR